MKQFDMRRFGLVLKLDFVEGWKPLLWNALLMVLAYLFMFWFCYNVSMKAATPYSPEYVRGVCKAVGTTGYVTIYIFFVVCASTVFRNVQKKQKLTSYLMLPATNLEKFLSRWIYMLAMSLVGGILTFFVADILHAAWLGLNGYPVYWASNLFLSAFSGSDKYWEVIVEVYCMQGLIYAFFFLGGVFFKRYHFVATGGVGLLLLSGFSWLLRVLGIYKHYDALAWKTSAAIDIAVTFAGIVLFIWLSYWLFCRYQVITRKLVNL